MTRFVRLTGLSGAKRLVNVDLVTFVRPGTGDYRSVHFGATDYVEVTETLDELESLFTGLPRAGAWTRAGE